MLPQMQGFKAILQQMQTKLRPANLDSIKKKDILTFKQDLVNFVEFVQAQGNRPFASLFFRSVVGLITIVNGIIRQLNTAKRLAEVLEKIEKDTRTPNFAKVLAETDNELQEYLNACREPIDKALKQFKI